MQENLADLSSEMMNFSLNERQGRPLAISEVRSIHNTTVGRELIVAISKTADVDGPSVESTFFPTPKNNKSTPNGVGFIAPAFSLTERGAFIAGPSTSSPIRNLTSAPFSDGLGRSNRLTFTELNINNFVSPFNELDPVFEIEDGFDRKPLIKSEGGVDKKPIIKTEDGVDRKPVTSMLDHKPFSLDFDHAPFIEVKPDVRELNNCPVVPIQPIRTYTNPPKISGLKRTVAKFSYRGLDSNFNINVVYLDLVNCCDIAFDDEDFGLFCATYGLLAHDWNSGPSIDDRVKQGYWPAQLYYDQMPTSVLVFCISDQELCERIRSERLPRADPTSIDEPEPSRRSERISHQAQRVVYNFGHDSDSD